MAQEAENKENKDDMAFMIKGLTSSAGKMLQIVIDIKIFLFLNARNV